MGGKKGRRVFPWKIHTATPCNYWGHVKCLKNFRFGKYFPEKYLGYESTKFPLHAFSGGFHFDIQWRRCGLPHRQGRGLLGVCLRETQSHSCLAPWSSVCSAENQILARQRVTTLSESCRRTGSGFFPDLRGHGPEVMAKEGSAPKVAGPIWTADVKKHTKCFYSIHSAAFSLFRATGLLRGSCSKWLINKIRVYE